MGLPNIIHYINNVQLNNSTKIKLKIISIVYIQKRKLINVSRPYNLIQIKYKNININYTEINTYYT